MFEAVLQGRSPCCWVRDLTGKYPAAVSILDLKAPDGEGVQELFQIDVRPDLTDAVMKEVAGNRHVREAEFIRSSHGRVYGAAKIRGKPICRAFVDSKCFLVSVRTRPGDEVEWRVRGTGDALKDLFARLEEYDGEVKVKRISNLDEEEHVTPRQKEILETGLQKGYFDFPRRLSLRSFAKEVGVQPSTLSELLRRAQKRALFEYLRSN